MKSESGDEHPKSAQPSNLEARIGEIIGHCEDELASLRGRNIMTDYLDTLNPSVRTGLIELAQQELETFRSLDPRDATDEEIESISRTFNQMRDTLHPKK